MSYFICGYKSESASLNKLEASLAGILPKRISTGLRMESGPSQLIIYGSEKVIRDVTIRNELDGSWMVVLGTPLICGKSQNEKLALLEEFLQKPSDALNCSIDGNFAVFGYDAKRDRFIAATDYNSTVPVFYASLPNGVFFSSHELALAKFLNDEIDPFGFCQSIYIGVTWSSYTRFRNIAKMLPCQIATIEHEKKVKTERYWSPHNETIWRGTLDDHIEKWLPLLKESVWKFYECSGQKPVIADFTAGEDTRLLIALCHALGIPFKAHVTGLDDSIDVSVAKQAAKILGIELIERSQRWITEEQLVADASNIYLDSDAYQEMTALCSEVATDSADPLDDYGIVKYCGVPGGEAFRGSYYLRGKSVFPSRNTMLDYKFFTRMKYLLDYYPGLIRYSDDDFLFAVHSIVEENLDDVKELPVGTQIDHMLRIFQTCYLGLKYKNPLYLPFATREMTQSIYNISPRFKQSGKLTKACTEMLYPELAFIKNQNGVPTIRRTTMRMHLFMPEYISVIRKIAYGAVGRLFKWSQANKWYYSHDANAYIFSAILNAQPYSNWFSSSEAMTTGYLYSPDIINPLLSKAREGSCRYIPILGRIIIQELALRWVRG